MLLSIDLNYIFTNFDQNKGKWQTYFTGKK